MPQQIQLRGAKLFAFDPETAQATPLTPAQLKSSAILPGDEVTFNSSTPSLTFLSRQPQVTLGVVKSYNPTSNNVQLHLPFFGPACPTTLSVSPIGDYKLQGCLYILWLSETGAVYPIDAAYKENFHISNQNFLATLYNFITPDFTRRPALPDIPIQNSFYTQVQGVETPFYTILDPTRTDETHLDTFTVDPTDSKDFDDAITVDISNNTLYVHIVDIAHATLSQEEETNLRDKCATLYLSHGHTVHLLSEENAEQNLSLVPGEPRDTITVKATLTPEGNVAHYDIYPSRICVKKRLDYAQANELIANGAHKQLLWLHRLTTQAAANQIFNIKLPSLRFENGIPHREDTKDASHSAVATAMILANLIVSKHLANHVKLPNRFHECLRLFTPLTPEQQTGNEEVDSFLMVKRNARALYSVEQKGHFGLGLTDYVHFTSPMRRYADVIVHRILAGWKYPADVLEQEVKWINMRSRLIKSIQDQEKSWLVADWLVDCGHSIEYDTWITGVSPAGVLWFVPSLNLNGFAHVSRMNPKQMWRFEAGTERLVGTERPVEGWRVGQKVRGNYVGTDPVTGVVSFDLHLLLDE